MAVTGRCEMVRGTPSSDSSCEYKAYCCAQELKARSTSSQPIPRYTKQSPSLTLLTPRSAIMKFISSLLLFIAPITLALPTTLVTDAAVDQAIEARACYVRCGSTCYTSSQVSAALNQGYNYYAEGSEAGSSTYPHTYNNYEGFDFPVDGPYQEFPLKSSVYTGGV